MTTAIAPDPVSGPVELPAITPEQMRALASLAREMETTPAPTPITSLSVPGLPALPGHMEVIGATSLRALAEEFLENHLARGNAHGTLENYRRALDRLMDVCPRLPVTPAHIREALKKPGWKSQSTRFLMFTHLRAFFNELEQLYGCPNPCRAVGPVDRGGSKRRILSMEQLNQVYDAATVTTRRPQYHKFTPRNQVMALLMIECGPRVGEIANIRPWDFADGWVTLDGKTGPRDVPVSREITDRMRDLVKGDVVWANYRGNAMSERDVDYLVSGLLVKTGITGPRLGVHLMRHSFATNYLRNGGGVFQLQAILGHASIQTTMRYVKLAGVDVQMDHSRASLAKALGLVDGPAPAEKS